VAQARKPSLEATASDVRRWPRSRRPRHRSVELAAEIKPVSNADTHSKRRKRELLMPFPPYAARPPHLHEWVGGLCVRLPRAEVGYVGEVPQPAQLVWVRVPLRHRRSRLTAQRSAHALRDLCRVCYREMRHADRVAHFVNW
jgi:hypothetical protein